jgi:hypothetical protein
MLLLLMQCSFTASTAWQPLPLTDVTRDQHAAFALLTDFRHLAPPRIVDCASHFLLSRAAELPSPHLSPEPVHLTNACNESCH